MPRHLVKHYSRCAVREFLDEINSRLTRADHPPQCGCGLSHLLKMRAQGKSEEEGAPACLLELRHWSSLDLN